MFSAIVLNIDIATVVNVLINVKALKRYIQVDLKYSVLTEARAFNCTNDG